MAAEAGKLANRKERENIANRFIHQKLQVWQDRMNMPDWNIQIRLSRSKELEPNTLGNVHWDLDQKEATIRVLSTYDYKLPFPAMLDDMEVTVVHELVHIQLAQLPRSDASRGQEEHAVVQLTDALLKLSKGTSAPVVASSAHKAASPIGSAPPSTH